jgi:hypothetical protein
MFRSSFPRRQQYGRVRRAAAGGAAGLAAGVLTVLAAGAGDLALAGVLVLIMVGLLIYARHWLRLASRSRVGARSEAEVRRALAPLRAEGWRLRHSLPYRGRGDIDSVAIAPTGIAFALVFCPHFGHRECPSLCDLPRRTTRFLPGCPSAWLAALTGWHSVVST